MRGKMPCATVSLGPSMRLFRQLYGLENATDFGLCRRVRVGVARDGPGKFLQLSSIENL
jgi:hypothetical protein